MTHTRQKRVPTRTCLRHRNAPLDDELLVGIFACGVHADLAAETRGEEKAVGTKAEVVVETERRKSNNPAMLKPWLKGAVIVYCSFLVR